MIDQLVGYFANPATRLRACGAAAILAILVLLLITLGVTTALGGGGSDEPGVVPAGQAGATARPAADEPDGSPEAEATLDAATAQADPTAASAASPTSTEAPAETETATTTPTEPPAGGTGSGSTAANTPTPAPAPPTAMPTSAPATTSNLPFCDSSSSTSPPTSAIGLLTVGGANAPAGTTVTLLFDGVAGYSANTAEAGGYRVDYWAGNSECANRVGAAISVAVNSQAFATGRAIGDGGGPVIRVDIALP